MSKESKDVIVKEEVLPFGKSEDEKDIYYLWGIKGEFFYVNKKQKTFLTIFLCAIGLAFTAGYWGYIYVDMNNLVRPSILNSFPEVLFIIISIFYISLLYLCRRSMSIQAISKKNRSASLRVILILLCVISISLSLLLKEGTSVLGFATVLYMTFITYFCVRVYKTKGHYFSG
jgi:hypothetical protein